MTHKVGEGGWYENCGERDEMTHEVGSLFELWWEEEQR